MYVVRASGMMEVCLMTKRRNNRFCFGSFNGDRDDDVDCRHRAGAGAACCNFLHLFTTDSRSIFDVDGGCV